MTEAMNQSGARPACPSFAAFSVRQTYQAVSDWNGRRPVRAGFFAEHGTRQWTGDQEAALEII